MPEPDSTQPDPVIALRGATATLGARPVLRGIDLTVHRGEVAALLGANGSGKSTAVRSVIGQVPLTGGSVELFGTPCAASAAGHGSATYRSAPRRPAGSPPPSARSSPPGGCPVRSWGCSARRTGPPSTAPSRSSVSPTGPGTR